MITNAEISTDSYSTITDSYTTLHPTMSHFRKVTGCSRQCYSLEIENNVEQRSFSTTNFKLNQSIEGKFRSPTITIDELTLHNDIKQSMKCFM